MSTQTEAQQAISKRAERAIEVLKSGGYFRYALERHYHGGEKFKMRLRSATGQVIAGVGHAACHELRAKGLLRQRSCPVSSTWPQEWELAQTEVMPTTIRQNPAPAKLVVIRAENARLQAAARADGIASPARFEGWVAGGTEDGYAVYSNVALS